MTGTKGKTTTASLVAAMLERGGLPSVLGGNIGTPLIERATELSPDDWAILELSELQLPTISRGADVALYTNIGEDHLDRHGTVAAYQAVKARLAELSAPSGRVVLNHDDAGCRALGDRLPPASVAWYGREEPGRGRIEAWLDEEGWVRVAGERLLPARDVRLPGRHMLSNVIGASLAASLVGVPARAIGEAIAAFEGVPHRLELIGERGGVRWINDSQATIPVAAMAALEAFDTPIVLISGGKDKGLAYGEFADAIAERARAAILIGETADELASLIGDRVPVERARDMPAAVAAAARARATGRRGAPCPGRGELRHVHRLRRARRRLPGGARRPRGGTMSTAAATMTGRRTTARGGVRRERHEPAYALLLAVMALTAIGIVMVYSASSVRSYFNDADPAAQGLEQIVWAAIGLVGLLVTSRIDFRHLRYLAIPDLRHHAGAAGRRAHPGHRRGDQRLAPLDRGPRGRVAPAGGVRKAGGRPLPRALAGSARQGGGHALERARPVRAAHRAGLRPHRHGARSRDGGRVRHRRRQRLLHGGRQPVLHRRDRLGGARRGLADGDQHELPAGAGGDLP